MGRYRASHPKGVLEISVSVQLLFIGLYLEMLTEAKLPLESLGVCLSKYRVNTKDLTQLPLLRLSNTFYHE